MLHTETFEDITKRYFGSKRRKLKQRITVVFVCLLLLGLFGLKILATSSITANFADDILRPTIGAQNTLTLESALFNLEDSFNKIRYRFIAPTEDFSMPVPAQTISPDSSKALELNPIPLKSFGFAALAGEGQWFNMPLSLFPNDTVIAKSFIRTDPQRPYAIVTLLKIDMHKLKLSAVAGTKEPGGGEGNPGPGKIPLEIQTSRILVAAFNGGFQEKDGHYGMIVAGKTYLPLEKGLATLTIDKNSNLQIINYSSQDLANYSVIRQNGGMLVQNGIVVPTLDNNQYGVWGRTVTNSMYTWRSGIGITAEGNLIYAVGPSLVPETLGEALKEAGAVNAMQLDINPYWVRFVLFTPQANGLYSHYSILKGMYDGGANFLNGYQKDFFYLYKR